MFRISQKKRKIGRNILGVLGLTQGKVVVFVVASLMTVELNKSLFSSVSYGGKVLPPFVKFYKFAIK